MIGRVSRRRFVKVAGAAVVLAGAAPVGGAIAGQPVILLDPRVSPDRWPIAAVVLTDPIRQWRDGLHDAISATGAVARVRWDIAIMLRHLGRDARLAVSIRQVSPALFTVHIRPR